MVKSAWLLFTVSMPAFCQSVETGNAAQRLLERRIQSMRLVTPADLRKPKTLNYVRVNQPQACAIGLEAAQSAGVRDSRMPVLQPKQPPLRGDVLATMPVCGE